MKLWIDTEFNSAGGDLISIGIVDEENREFYEVLELHQVVHPWVRDNVIPVLNKAAISIGELKSKLSAYLKHPAHNSLEIVADHPVDVEHFMRLIQLGNEGDWMWLPPTTVTLAIGLGATAKTSNVPHNALADALALREAYLKAGR